MDACTQCVKCADLTIEHLVDLAHKEFSRDDRVPIAACYQLHDSIEGLETAADAGCEFCSLLLGCLKGYVDNGHGVADEWEDEDCNSGDSLLALARQLPQSEVRLCIASEDSGVLDMFADVKVLDTLLVQVGPHDLPVPWEDVDNEIESFPVLKLTLASSRGMCRTIAYLVFDVHLLNRRDLSSQRGNRWAFPCWTI